MTSIQTVNRKSSLKQTAALTLFSLLLTPAAKAFTILSPLTEGCHERILLGALDNEKTGFVGDGQPSTATFLARLVARIPADQIPKDRLTQGLITEMTNRYGWQDLDISTRFVLASFIAGVRAPDTDGFSVANFNDLRSTQIRDDGQPAHSLRQKADDYADGNTSAIQHARDLITSELNQLTAAWNASGTALGTQRWTFAFYGSQDVTVFEPAYTLGLIVHALEDSYAHTIRDDNFKIVAVSNYLEVILNAYNENRDGPAHSDRLDQCNLKDDFDSMRINEARKQVGNFLNQVDTILQANGTDLTAANTALDTIYTYRSGCDLSNKYCNTTWYQKSEEDTSQPYNLGLGCGSISPTLPPPPPSSRNWMLALLSLPFALVIWMRRRAVKGAK